MSTGSTFFNIKPLLVKIIFTLTSVWFLFYLSAAQENGTARPVPTVKMRCRGSIPDSKPLIVVDGVPWDYDQFSKIDPNDIESIDILKEEAASAIYGNFPSGGVIVISTKSARERKFILHLFHGR